MALRLGDGVERLPGIGPARARSLEKLGLATVEDLLRYFPRDYEDRRRFSIDRRSFCQSGILVRHLIRPFFILQRFF